MLRSSRFLVLGLLLGVLTVACGGKTDSLVPTPTDYPPNVATPTPVFLSQTTVTATAPTARSIPSQFVGVCHDPSGSVDKILLTPVPTPSFSTEAQAFKEALERAGGAVLPGTDACFTTGSGFIILMYEGTDFSAISKWVSDMGFDPVQILDARPSVTRRFVGGGEIRDCSEYNSC